MKFMNEDGMFSQSFNFPQHGFFNSLNIKINLQFVVLWADWTIKHDSLDRQAV